MTTPNLSHWPANLPQPIGPASGPGDSMPPGLYDAPPADAPAEMKAVCADCRAETRAHPARTDAILHDKMLSAEGRRRALEKAEAVRDGILANGDGLTTKYRQGLAASRERAAASAAPLPITTAEVSRHAESTRFLLAKSGDELTVISNHAAKLGDRETLIAIAHLPRALSPDDTALPWRKIAQAALLEASKPGIEREFAAAEQHIAYLDGLVQAVRAYTK